MAKKSIRERSKKRENLVDRYKKRRADLKVIIKLSANFDEVMAAQLKLAKLPLNSNPVRSNTRCRQCSRSHAVYKKFGLCRICLRQQLMAGNVPGGRKSSW